LKVPVKLTLTVFSNQSRSTGPVRPTTAAPGPMPAQFTKILAVPWASLAKLIAFEALSGSLTSHSMAIPLIYFAVSFAPSICTSSSAILEVFLLRILAVAAPKPDPPPVIITEVLLISMIYLLSMSEVYRSSLVNFNPRSSITDRKAFRPELTAGAPQ